MCCGEMALAAARFFIPLTKKVMRNCSVFLLMGLLALSCGLSEIGGNTQNVNVDVWGRPVGDSQSGIEVLESVCYVTTVDYAKGYDWRSDPAPDGVRCSLAVYLNSSPIMKVPVGSSYYISAESDMHRITGGCLYTDYCTENETFVRRNAKLLFSYPGSERICGLVEHNGDVYTLGENRKGEGFSYRRNGETVISRANAFVATPLRADGDSLCFGFSEQIRSVEGAVDMYYSVYGSKITNLSARFDIKMLWDAFTVNGQVECLVSLRAFPYPVLIKGEDVRALNVPKGMTLLSGSMFKVGELTGVEGLCKTSGGSFVSVIWVDTNPLISFDGMTIASVWVDGAGISCVLNPKNSNSSGIIYRCGEKMEMPKGYTCIGSHNIAMVNGILHVGLSSLNGERPLLWRDGILDTLSVNGYISGLYVE